MAQLGIIICVTVGNRQSDFIMIVIHWFSCLLKNASRSMI